VGVPRSTINSFARALKSGDDTSTLWTPPPPQWSLQQGTIVGVDVGNNVAHVQPNGAPNTVVAYQVRYINAYGPQNPPQVGDNAWGHYNGQVLLLLGSQNVPAATVIL
jgi:hypothetical protein